MKQNPLSIIALAALLAGCQGGAQPIDAQKFLSGLEGPKVPSVQDALLETARKAEAQGDFAQAAQLYQQILEKHPDNTDAAVALGDCYRRLGQNDKALAVYDGVLRQDPEMLAAKEGKGLALMAKGDFATAGPIFESIMKEDPKRWKTLNALGILFTTRNMQPEAQQYFNEALKYNPDSASVTNNIGLSQALERRYGVVGDTLEKASSLAPANSRQRKRIDLNRALVFALQGKLDDARAIAGNYYSGAALDNNLGLYAHLAKDDQLAKAYLNMALTESKVFYEKAWDNLKTIDTVAEASPSAGGQHVEIVDNHAKKSQKTTHSAHKHAKKHARKHHKTTKKTKKQTKND